MPDERAQLVIAIGSLRFTRGDLEVVEVERQRFTA